MAVTGDARGSKHFLLLSLFILAKLQDYWLEPLTGRLALPLPFAGPLVNHPQIAELSDPLSGSHFAQDNTSTVSVLHSTTPTLVCICEHTLWCG